MIKKTAYMAFPVLLCFITNVFAQEKADPGKAHDAVFTLQQIPDTLEGMLSRALQSSPDIRVAEADLLHAQASVKQVRLKVSQAVVGIYHDLNAQRTNLKHVKQELSRVQNLIELGRAGGESEIPHLQALSEGGARLARSEAMIRTILGIESPAAKPPETLEDLLANSFDANADIALAESVTARMLARLNQTRFKVMQEVADAFQARRVKRSALDMARRKLELAQHRVEKGLISKNDEMEPIQALIESEAELMQIEAHIRYLLGLGGKIQSKKQGPEKGE